MTPRSPRRPFNLRAFAGVGMACAGLGLPFTGWANHVLQFEPMTVARHAWMTAHDSLAVLFVAFAACHVVLNRRSLWNYLRGGIAGVAGRRREILFAVAVVAVPTVVAVSHAFHLR